jgi:hypothetical protein
MRGEGGALNTVDEPVLEREIVIATKELSEEFDRVVPANVVERAVQDSFEVFAGSQIKTYVPILARREARQQLRILLGQRSPR